MFADDVSEKRGSLLFPFICLKMSALSFWWSLVQALDANLGISSPLNPFTLLNRPGRLSLPTPDAGRLKCPSASPNVKWRLNPHACSLGKPASNSCLSLPSLMPSYSLFSPTPTSCFACSPPIATELESGAKTLRTQLHFIVCAWRFLASGSSSALTPCLP